MNAGGAALEGVFADPADPAPLERCRSAALTDEAREVAGRELARHRVVAADRRLRCDDSGRSWPNSTSSL